MVIISGYLINTHISRNLPDFNATFQIFIYISDTTQDSIFVVLCKIGRKFVGYDSIWPSSCRVSITIKSSVAKHELMLCLGQQNIFNKNVSFEIYFKKYVCTTFNSTWSLVTFTKKTHHYHHRDSNPKMLIRESKQEKESEGIKTSFSEILIKYWK